MVAALKFQDRSFSIPSETVAIADSGERLALAIATGGAVYFGRDLVQDSLEIGAVDLGLVRRGRSPVLIEHCWSTDSILGMVVDAEVEGEILRALVRFARGGQSDRYWDLLEQGFPLSLSVGARVNAAEVLADNGDRRLIRVTVGR